MNRKGNQDRQTSSLYSCQKAPWRKNNRHCWHNIRWWVLFLCSLQGRMCQRASTLKILSTGSFRHRNLKNTCSQGQKKATYEWHNLSSSSWKHSRTLGVGSRNVLHAGRVRSKAISGCLANWQPTILLTLKDENNCGKEIIYLNNIFLKKDLLFDQIQNTKILHSR